MKSIVKRFFGIFTVFVITTICLTSCDNYYSADYIVRGRVIDKITGEPVENILVSSHKYDTIPPRDGHIIQSKRTPPLPYSWSHANGEFSVWGYNAPFSSIYIYGYSSNENGLYKDTVISVDFSNVPLSGKPSREFKYKGDYVLNIGDIALEKIE